MTSKFLRILSIKVTFYFKISWLASCCAVQGSPERKYLEEEKEERKHLRGSGKAEKKNKDWKKMEG